MTAPVVTLEWLEQEHAIARLPAASPIPSWADGDGFVSISRSRDELSIICPAQRVPAGIRADYGWQALRFVGPFAFTETGIAAAVLAPLAKARIGILLVSTFDTDYLLVKATDAARTAEALAMAGHRISE